MLMEILLGTKQLKDYVVVDDMVSYGGSECPCDHEGCNQDECSLKT